MKINQRDVNSMKRLCKDHEVDRLYLFGSFLTDKFKSDSDVDMVVDFKDISTERYADNYFKLKYALEEILGRKVDLLEEKAIKNPFLKKEINANKKLFYAEKS